MQQILYTRIPRLSRSHFGRGRLLLPLIDGDPLVIVRAPAGTGKTALLAEFATQVRSSPATHGDLVWISATRLPGGAGAALQLSPETDALRAAFWRELCAAVGAMRKDEVEGALEPSIGVRREEFASHLNGRDRPVRCVVDEAWFLSADDAAALLDLLQRFPTFSLVVASRTRTPLESARTVVAVDTTVLHEEDLRLTRAECARLLGEKLPDISDNVVEAVWNLTRGSVALVRSSVQYLLDDAPADERALFFGLTRHVRNASLVDVDAALEDPDLERFALVMSLCEEFTVDMASEAASRTEAWDFILRLEQAGLGSWRTSPYSLGPVFRFSPVVLPTLRRRAHQQIPDSEMARVCAALVGALEDLGEPVAAFAVAVVCRSWSVAEDLLQLNIDIVLAAPLERLERITARVPEQMAQRYPMLSVLVETVRACTRSQRMPPPRPLQWSEGATSGRRERSDPVRDAVFYAAQATSARKEMHVVDAVDLALRSVKLLESVPAVRAQLAANAAALSLVQNAQTLLVAGRWEAARRALLSVNGVARTRQTRSFIVSAKAATLALCGDVRGARDSLVRDTPGDGVTTGAEPAERTVLSESTQALRGIAVAVGALETFDVELADAAVDGLREHTAIREYWPIVAFLQARVDLLAGNYQQGLARLASARDSHVPDSLAPAMRAELDAARQLLLAAADSRTPMVAVLASPGRGASPADLLMAARSLFRAGRLPQALQVLSKALELDDATDRHRAEALALQAAILRRYDSEPDVRNVVGALTVSLQNTQTRMALALVPAGDISALAKWDAERGNGDLQRVISDVRARPIVLEPAAPLTRRELQVRAQLSSDQTLTELGEHLFLSQNTVRTHVKSIYRKLGVSKRQDAVVIAAMLGLLERPSP